MKAGFLLAAALACVALGVVAVAWPDRARLPVTGDKRRSGIVLIVVGLVAMALQLARLVAG